MTIEIKRCFHFAADIMTLRLDLSITKILAHVFWHVPFHLLSLGTLYYYHHHQHQHHYYKNMLATRIITYNLYKHTLHNISFWLCDVKFSYFSKVYSSLYRFYFSRIWYISKDKKQIDLQQNIVTSKWFPITNTYKLRSLLSWTQMDD